MIKNERKNHGLIGILRKMMGYKKINFNYKDTRLNHVSPLAFACGLGYYGIVKELLKVPEIDVNIRDVSNRTPLFYVIMKNYIDIMDELLQIPTIDIKDKFEETPLVYAVYNRLYPVKRLIDYKVDYNTKTSCESTAFIMACFRNFIDIVIEFLKLPDIRYNDNDKFGNTALDYAHQQGNKYIVLLIRERIFKDIKDFLPFSSDICKHIIYNYL